MYLGAARASNRIIGLWASVTWKLCACVFITERPPPPPFFLSLDINAGVESFSWNNTRGGVVEELGRSWIEANQLGVVFV